jgi:hypothetical protein
VLVLLKDREYLHDVGISGAELVAGAITTDDDVHGNPIVWTFPGAPISQERTLHLPEYRSDLPFGTTRYLQTSPARVIETHRSFLFAISAEVHRSSVQVVFGTLGFVQR